MCCSSSSPNHAPKVKKMEVCMNCNIDSCCFCQYSYFKRSLSNVILRVMFRQTVSTCSFQLSLLSKIKPRIFVSSRFELIHYLKYFEGISFLTMFHESPLTYGMFSLNHYAFCCTDTSMQKRLCLPVFYF